MIGKGVLKGMAITAKNFIGSYYDPERLTTVQYPEEKAPIPENYRSFPFLVYDGEDAIDGLRCTACRICEKECPPQCIYIVPCRDEKGKVVKQPAIFDIDISVCMSCSICVEVCPFESIKMDQVYAWSKRERFNNYLLHREDLAKPNSYYQKIHPTDAAASDASLAEAAAKKAKKPEPAAAAPAPAAAKTPVPAA
jgi:NADH-quinone oxidoreductase subunit I